MSSESTTMARLISDIDRQEARRQRREEWQRVREALSRFACRMGWHAWQESGHPRLIRACATCGLTQRWSEFMGQWIKKSRA